MRNGWVKLHLATLDNEVFRRDHTAWIIFTYLLLQAYAGKPQGTVVTSRYKIADAIGGNNNTVYKALIRLRNAKMVTTKVTNKFTTINICNWSKYQSNGNQSSNNKVTTKQQQSNTLIRIKNKDIRNSTTYYGKPEINEMFTYWLTKTGLPITAKAQANRRACSNLLNKYGEEKLQRLIDGVAVAQADQYAPRIADFTQLQQKVDELILWGKQKSTKPKTGVVR